VLGEILRSHLFPKTSRKWKLYSGLFVLLKLKLVLPFPECTLVKSLREQNLSSAFCIVGKIVQQTKKEVSKPYTFPLPCTPTAFRLSFQLPPRIETCIYLASVLETNFVLQKKPLGSSTEYRI
jgi:hypothetical protein